MTGSPPIEIAVLSPRPAADSALQISVVIPPERDMTPTTPGLNALRQSTAGPPRLPKRQTSGMITPRQFGPMMRAPRRLAYSIIAEASLRAMPSVMMTISLMPASTASSAASSANAAGTVMTVPSTLEAVVLGAPDRFHGIVLPKVHGPDDVRHVARVLDDLEHRGGWRRRLQIECLIETPQALLRAYEIASASDRMCGLIFGIADFAASLGIREIVDDQSVNFLYAKQSMVISAKAAGLHAIDNVYTKLNRLSDSPEQKQVVEAGLRKKNLQAAAMGMDGTWIVHPQQAKIANECFTPTPAQIAEARRVVELYHAKGGGSMADPETGDMIDEATIKVALMDLAKGLQNGDVDPQYLAEQASKSREVTGYDILNLVRRHS